MMRATIAFSASIVAASCGFSVPPASILGYGGPGTEVDPPPDAAPGVDTDGDGIDDIDDNSPARWSCTLVR